MKYCRDSVGCV